ncbi:MAG: hypothetical protein ACQEP2_06005 [Actinomycetota bacterium]
MIRGFLIFLNIVVTLVYIAMFIFLEPLFQLVDGFIVVSPFLLNSAKFFLLIVIAFCIGNLTQVFTRTRYEKSFWDIKNFIKLSIIPAIFLIAISIDPVLDIITSLPIIRENPSEFLYYLISSRYVWIMWIGFNLGASIKFSHYYMPRRAKTASKNQVV